MDFTPVMCPPSLTELCRYLFIKEIVRFPAGSGRLLFTAAEQQPENGTAQRAAVQHLPAQGHGHVAAPGVHPGAENSSVATRLITGHMMQTIISMRSARPPAAAAEVFHKRGPRLGGARRNAGLRTVFVVFCRLFSIFQQKFVYFFV